MKQNVSKVEVQYFQKQKVKNNEGHKQIFNVLLFFKIPACI